MEIIWKSGASIYVMVEKDKMDGIDLLGGWFIVFRPH
jgi:hypothetical protein